MANNRILTNELLAEDNIQNIRGIGYMGGFAGYVHTINSLYEYNPDTGVIQTDIRNVSLGQGIKLSNIEIVEVSNPKLYFPEDKLKQDLSIIYDICGQ